MSFQPPNSPAQTSQQYSMALTVIHGALLMGIVMFSGVAWFVNQNSPMNMGDTQELQIFQMLLPFFVVASIGGTMYLGWKRLPKIKEQETLSKKLISYRNLLITSYALLEGAAMLILAYYLMTGNMTALGLAAIIVFYFFIERPTLSKTIRVLELTAVEKKKLSTPDEIVI